MLTFFALIIIVASGFFIIKKYNTTAVLFLAGILMMGVSVIFEGESFLPKKVDSSGLQVIDFFVVISSLFSSTLAELGLIIMSVGGFAKYMSHIGAANSLVKLTTKPLALIKSPYVILALTYILGQFLNVFIPSAVGLAMLLLVALYPVLVKVGCTPASVATVIATTACLDLGPASSAANNAAKVLNIDAASYFIELQLLPGVVTAIVIAILHYFTQKWFDKRDILKGVNQTVLNEKEDTARAAPQWFAILPVLPLFILLVFSRFVIDTIKIDVVTAMFISLAFSMLCDYLYTRKGKEVAASLKVYLQGMGDVFANVVSLIIAAQTFIVGLKAIGFISALLALSSQFGFGYTTMVLFMVAIIGLTTLLSGSGNAAFFSFSGIAPELSAGLGVSAAAFIVPMQLSAGLFRSFSPVSGVVIACAGTANIAPTEVAKRAAIPMIGGIITIMIVTFLEV